MQAYVPQYNCVASLLVVMFVPLHIIQYIQRHAKHCINERGLGMREMEKRDTMTRLCESLTQVWKPMNLFLGGNGIKPHPPVSDRSKCSM